MTTTRLSVDALGGDFGAATTLGGLALYQARENASLEILLHGDEAILTPSLKAYPALNNMVEIHHTAHKIDESLKASIALRKGKDTGMWNAIESVRTGDADVALSAGNTGALMAIAIARLKRLKGVYRPALTALWPTPTGMTVVLDVGANIDADETMLCDFAKLGHAYAKAMLGKTRPRIALLNVGSEDQKGSDIIRAAAQALAEGTDLNFTGYVEGDKISQGVCDVVVTGGFAGNAALKAGEGVARLVAGYVREALTQSILTKAGAVLASGGLNKLKEKMDPANVNAGVMLGLGGLVVKSHGGASAKAFAKTVEVAHTIAKKNIMADIKDLVKDRKPTQ